MDSLATVAREQIAEQRVLARKALDSRNELDGLSSLTLQLLRPSIDDVMLAAPGWATIEERKGGLLVQIQHPSTKEKTASILMIGDGASAEGILKFKMFVNTHSDSKKINETDHANPQELIVAFIKAYSMHVAIAQEMQKTIPSNTADTPPPKISGFWANVGRIFHGS